MTTIGRSPITVRGLERPEELEWVCRLSAATFGNAEDREKEPARFLRHTTESPEYRPGQWRGAFRDGQPVGGYIIHEREMRVGAARLRTGCIGSVMTDPTARMGGVGRALMLDAIEYARRRKFALLLLDGIPDFYGRFGYVDVFDLAEHLLAREAITALPSSRYRTRPVRESDASAVLCLYDRQFRRYTGSFERSPAVQRHRLRDDLGPWPMTLALDEQGTARGYLEIRRHEPARAIEAASEDWPATVALLHEHIRLLNAREEKTSLPRWPLPMDSPILAELIDRLALPDTSHREHVTTLWSVETQIYHHPNAGWLARPADIGVLLDALLPAWQERWVSSTRPWRGTLTLEVDGESRNLMLGEEVRFGRAPGKTVRLTAGALVQLVFGYRDAERIARRDGNDVPEVLVPTLRILFPAGQAWIPGSDAF